MHNFPLSLPVSQDKDGRTGGHLLPRGMNFSPNYSKRIILGFKRGMDADREMTHFFWVVPGL